MGSLYKVDGSRAAMPEELDLFTTPITNTAVEGVEWMEITPSTQYGANTIVDFKIENAGDYYLDLSRTLLSFTPTKVLGTEKSSVCNNILHSYWKNIEVSICGTQLPQGSTNYHHKAFLEKKTLTKIGAQESQNFLQGYVSSSDIDGSGAAGFITDFDYSSGPYAISEIKDDGQTPAKFRGLTLRPGWDQERYELNLVQNKNLIGPLNHDLFQMKRYLLNDTRVDIKMYPNSPAVYMLMKDTESKGITPVDLKLYVCRVKVSPEIRVRNNALLAKGDPCIYPYLRTELKAMDILSEETRFSNLFSKRVPSRMVMTVIKSENYNGKSNVSPFEYLNTYDISVEVDGVAYPVQEFKGAFKDYSLYQSLGPSNESFGNDVIKRFLKNANNPNLSAEVLPTAFRYQYSNNPFTVVDLTGMGFTDENYPLLRNGEVVIKYKSSTYTTDYKLLILAYFPTQFTLDAARNCQPYTKSLF